MRGGNPHAPSGAWLHSVAGVGFYEDSEPGDVGEHLAEVDDHTFRVTVENLPDPDEHQAVQDLKTALATNDEDDTELLIRKALGHLGEVDV